MKISFPKYGPGELLTRKPDATRVIWFVAIALFSGVAGSYLLKHQFWLLVIAVLGVVGIFLCLGAAVAIVLNRSKVDGALIANIRENVPRITSQWDYRPRKAIRALAVFDSPGAETSEALSPDPFVINNNVWSNDDSLEGATPTFVNTSPDGDELKTKVVSEAPEPVCTAPTVDDAIVSTYDQSPIDERTAMAE
jgi:hypothetical protein